MSDERLYMGLDSSTQGLKATLVDTSLAVVCEDAINFDDALPEFGTEGGVHRHPDGLTVTSPPLMWVGALDILFSRMTAKHWPLDRVAAISGSGQQHGSVWWKAGARESLAGLRETKPMRELLADSFALGDSPVWMDSSTTRQCEALELALGGAQAVADLTGSRAYERFTGNQIAKIWQTQPDIYEATERIALVSSFVASLLAGDYAPIDHSDAAGMNLMDFRGRAWAPKALDATAPALEGKLGPLVAAHTTIGRIHTYYVRRFGFDATCRVIAFSGDNPNSLAGLRLAAPGDVAISMGTSDTLFASMRKPSPSGNEGHIFPNPVDPNAYMGMICRKNGSLTRETIRDRLAAGSWDRFNALLEQAPVGNSGCMGIYLDEPEITPPILKVGNYRYNASGVGVGDFEPGTEIRALLEGQFLSMRLHAGQVGIEPRRVIATGGASVNPAILQIVANVFGSDVYVTERADSASLGAACRALHGATCADQGRFVPFADIMEAATPFTKAAAAQSAHHATYTSMLARMDQAEKALAAG